MDNAAQEYLELTVIQLELMPGVNEHCRGAASVFQFLIILQ